LLALVFARQKRENESFSRVFPKQAVYSHTTYPKHPLRKAFIELLIFVPLAGRG
jgi:hypothetical protein